MSPEIAARLINIVSILSIGLAMALAGGAHPATDGLAVMFYDLVNWPFGDDVAAFSKEARLLSAILGGVFASLSIIFMLVIAPGVRRSDQAVRRAGVIGLVSWFVIDSAGSMAAGVPMNVVFNVIYLISLLVPLVAARLNMTARSSVA